MRGLPRTKSWLALLVLIVALALTASISLYEYEMVIFTSHNQQQLENGVPIIAVNDCLSTSLGTHHPGNSDFQHLLPKTLENATIGGFGLVDYLLVTVKTTGFLLYEVWNVTLVTSNPLLTTVNINMLYTVKCELP